MIPWVSSTIVRPTSSTVAARLSRAGRGLEDLELRGAGLGLLEQLGVAERDGGVRRQRRDEGDVAARPRARLAGHGRQGADHLVVVDERRRSGGRRPRTRRRSAPRRSRGRPGRPGRRARGRCAGPRRPSPPLARRRACRPATSSGMPAQAAISSWSSRRMRIVVASARRTRFVSSTIVRNSSAPVVRRGEPAGDPEDGVEPLGELGLEHETGSGRSAGMPRLHRQGLGDGRDAVGPDDPPDDRAGRRGPRSVCRRDGQRRPDGCGSDVVVTVARAHVRIVAPQARLRRAAKGPGHDQDDRRPLTLDQARTTLRARCGLPCPGRRIQHQRSAHIPWTTVPVRSAPVAPITPGTRSVPPSDG